jgi:hypothetical protein
MRLLRACSSEPRTVRTRQAGASHASPLTCATVQGGSKEEEGLRRPLSALSTLPKQPSSESVETWLQVSGGFVSMLPLGGKGLHM